MAAARELRGRPCRRYDCSPSGARAALCRGARAALTMDLVPPSPWSRAALRRGARDALATLDKDPVPPSIAEPVPTSPRRCGNDKTEVPTVEIHVYIDVGA
jgi:hypothetical protein